PPLPGGHRLRHHRGRRRDHDGEHPAPSRGAQAARPARGAGGAARRGGGGAPPHLRRPHHHDRLRAHPHLPAHRGEAVPSHGGDHLPCGDRRSPAHPDPDPRPLELPFPPPALGAGEPVSGGVAPPLSPRPPLVRAPAASPPPGGGSAPPPPPLDPPPALHWI